MDDNKKFSIREYREALYADIIKRKKEQRKKWQAKYLQKLGVTYTSEVTELEHSHEKGPKKDEEGDVYRSMLKKNE